MLYLRCKCGKSERWDSTGQVVRPCEGCSQCNTTYADLKDDHDVLQPHQFESHIEQHIVDGVVIELHQYKECRVCHFVSLEGV